MTRFRWRTNHRRHKRIMNDNYLWDRSGEPDAEIRELEELLGTLKYQPQPLQIPSNLRAGRKRSFIPLAIAAAIAVMMIAAGLWIRFNGSHGRPAIQAKENQPAPAANQTPRPSLPDLLASSAAQDRINGQDGPGKSTARRVRNNPRPIRTTPPPLTAQELAEKDQVLIALRLVSAKLNLAQRKTQALPPLNTIRN